MKKKLYAILLSLCMAVTMMPVTAGVAWAEDTIQMYEVWWPYNPDKSEDGQEPEPELTDNVIAKNKIYEQTEESEVPFNKYHYAGSIGLDGEGYYVKYFCYKNTEGNFVILSGTPTDTNNKITFASEASATGEEDAIGWEIDWSKASKGDKGRITITQDSKTYSMSYEVTGEMQSGGGDDENSAVLAKNQLLVCTATTGNEGAVTYNKMEVTNKDGESYNPESPAQFYMPQSGNGTFYVLVDTECKLATADSLEIPIVDWYGRETNSKLSVATEKLAVGTSGGQNLEDGGDQENNKPEWQIYSIGEGENQKTYFIWKVEVIANAGDGDESNETNAVPFSDKMRIGFEFDDTLACYSCNPDDEGARTYTEYMWILDGNTYCEVPEGYLTNSEGYNEIYVCEDKPDSNYTSSNDLNAICINESKSINLSEQLSEDSNTFYVVYPSDKTPCDETYELYEYDLDGSGIGYGRKYGGYFAKKVEDAYEYTDSDDISVGSTTYKVKKVKLNSAHGHLKLRTDFYLTDSSSGSQKVAGTSASIELWKGMNVVIKGADAASNVKVISESDSVDVALGVYGGNAEIEFTENTDGDYVGFMPTAAARVSDEGTGMQIGFSIDLADGYVIQKVTGADNAELGYTYDYTTFYSPLDGNGNKIETEREIRGLGWESGVVGSGDKKAIDVFHCVAAVEPNYMGGYRYTNVGKGDVTDFSDFLAEKKDNGDEVKVEERLSYNDYTIYFDPNIVDGDVIGEQIVFQIAKAAAGTEVAVANNGTTTTDITSKKSNDSAANAKIEERFDELKNNEYRVLTSYEMEAGDNADVSGLYNITIPASDLDGVDPKTCTVVYYGEDNVPMEMETTYTTDENGNATGIVFTTGHFSNYAIMTTEAKKSNHSGGSGGGSSAVSELEKAKNEAKADVKAEAEAQKYDEAEAAEVKAIKEQAEKDIAAAKTVEEVKAIEAEAEAKIEAILTTEEKAQVAAVTGVNKQVFKAKSKKTKKNGKPAVKVTWTLPNGMNVDGYEVYRSTKKNSGYGTKPYFTTTKTSYINNKELKAGKTYYYKVRAYILVNGEKIYTGWSTKAYRTI